MLRIILFSLILITTVHTKHVIAPEWDDSEPVIKCTQAYPSVPERIIRERRVMRVTAYTAHDKGMNSRGITASGERVRENHTLAAPREIPFGTKIHIPDLGRTYTVTDRGGAIRGNRLDVYIPDRKNMIEFGVKYLEVEILD